MRALFLVLLAACDPEPLSPDASVDASTIDAKQPSVCSDYTAEQSFSSPVGGCCVESLAPLCARASGACVVDKCVRQCTGTQATCRNGEPVLYTRPNGDVVCTCPGD